MLFPSSISNRNDTDTNADKNVMEIIDIESLIFSKDLKDVNYIY